MPADGIVDERTDSRGLQSTTLILSYSFHQAPLQPTYNRLPMRRIIVGITGASGSLYGYMVLQALRAIGGIETHLVLTAAARRTIELETDMTAEDFEALADVVHRDDDLAAAISSGSFLTDGMLVIPCSMKSASAIAYSMNSNLLVRAADVCLKEKRRLVLVMRETPLHLGHLRTLAQLAEIGAVILPPDSRDVRQSAERRRHHRAYRRQGARSVRHRKRALQALAHPVGSLVIQPDRRRAGARARRRSRGRR